MECRPVAMKSINRRHAAANKRVECAIFILQGKLNDGVMESQREAGLGVGRSLSLCWFIYKAWNEMFHHVFRAIIEQG